MINWIKNWIKRQQWGIPTNSLGPDGHHKVDHIPRSPGFPYGALVNWND